MNSSDSISPRVLTGLYAFCVAVLLHGGLGCRAPSRQNNQQLQPLAAKARLMIADLEATPAVMGPSGEDLSLPKEETFTDLFLIILAAVGSALVFVFLYALSVRRRIRRVTAFVSSLLDAPPQESSLIEGNGEIGKLSKSLNRTAVELRGLIEKLRLESARREAILASMVEGVLAVDQNLRVTFCNQSFARAAGVSWPAPAGALLLDLIRDPGLLDMLMSAISSGNPSRRRLELGGAEGRSYEIQVAPSAPDSSRGAIAILHDITDLERLERVRKDFVANVSHELRTPLTAIRGYAETLLDGALEDQENNRKFVEIIKAHSIRLNNIASDLLTLSRLESGKPVDKETIAIRNAVENVVRTVEAEARLRKVKVKCREIEDLTLSGDRGLLEQALLNLLDNAVKFNHPGGEVWIEAARSFDARILISVSDTGTGIPSGDLPRIFERFYRVDKARSREVGGTGLGLSIVKHIIERMGGTITVESELGKGSTFTISLPSA
jgi:two-component system, OmpR family, phosphate regulon sensor histidine kinase PhoR